MLLRLESYLRARAWRALRSVWKGEGQPAVDIV
jgi:hypothetical protein